MYWYKQYCTKAKYQKSKNEIPAEIQNDKTSGGGQLDPNRLTLPARIQTDSNTDVGEKTSNSYQN